MRSVSGASLDAGKGTDTLTDVVNQFSASDATRWDAFVRSSERGTFFHLAAWRTLIENETGHRTYYIYTQRGDSISGVLPLVHVKSLLFGNALISTPFLVYGGPIAVDEVACRALIDEACRIAEELNVGYLELRNRDRIDGDQWEVKSSQVTFRKHISPDPDENLAAIPRKQRAMIRKGIKAGLQAEVDTDANRLYQALLVCKRNLGTPFFSKQWLHAIKETFGDDAQILTITHEGQTVCSVMSFVFGNEILPYYGGGGDLARHLKGNDFMYWAVMEQACRDGCEIFDYGRSQVGSGAYRFKKHWGFEPEPLAYQYYLVGDEEIPQLNPSNPRYKAAIQGWKRLPLPVAGVLGPYLARRLG